MSACVCMCVYTYKRVQKGCRSWQNERVGVDAFSVLSFCIFPGDTRVCIPVRITGGKKKTRFVVKAE